jgi:tetratricopeptide (TPR) repeat protein
MHKTSKGSTRVLLAGALFSAALSVNAADSCQLQQIGTLPVTMSGTRPHIAGTINGQPAVFLADSGTFFSTFTPQGAQKFQLKLGMLPEHMFIYGIGGSANAKRTTVKDFSLVGLEAGHVFHNVEFAVAGSASLRGADGIIGQNVIGTADTEYDLANGVIRIFHTKDCGEKSLAYWAGNAVVASLNMDRRDAKSPHIIGDGTINGTNIRIVFDTGASSSVLTYKAAARAGIKPEQEDVQAAGSMRGLGKKSIDVSAARFDELNIGGEKIQNARLLLGDLRVANDADMLLGSDFFLSHRVYVSTKQHKLYFTYNGGRVFDLGPGSVAASAVTAANKDTAVSAPADVVPQAVPDAVAAPGLDAESLRRRGAASAGRRDFASAIADFDQAIKLEPNDPENYYQRGMVRFQTREAALALSDFDQALQLKPDHAPALVERGTVRLARNDRTGANADFDAAIKAQPGDSAIALRVAQSFISTRHFEGAIERYDYWIATFPKDNHMALALNGRCWARAVTNQGLDKALADCNAALKVTSDSQLLDSRGLVWLRRGETDKAIADFKASLELQPRSAMTLYGLGIAKVRKGKKAEGEHDMQAAAAITPGIAGFFKTYSIAP